MTKGLFDSNYRIPSIFDSAYRIPPIFDADPPASTYIQSVQDFEIILRPGVSGATATISTVNLTRAWIEIGFWEVSGTNDVYSDALALYELTDANTVSIYRNPINGLSNTIIARGRVIYAKPALVTNVQYASAVIAASVTTGSVVVSAVSLANTMISYAGLYHDGPYPWASAGPSGTVDVSMPDAVTVAIVRASADANSAVLSAFIVNFNPAVISSIQSIQANLNITPFDVTISALSNINNAIISYNGGTVNGGGVDQNAWGGFILDSTTVRAIRSVIGGKMFARFQVIEFAIGVLKSTAQQILSVITGGSLQTNSAISTVLRDRSFVKWNGLYTNSGSYRSSFSAIKIDPVVDNVVNDRANNTSTTSTNAQVVEFN